MITRYDSKYLYPVDANMDDNALVRKYRTWHIERCNGVTRLPFPGFSDAAKAQMSAAYLYHDQMGEGSYAPDADEVRMFLDWVWDAENDTDVDATMQLIAIELDRNFGVDLWWTFHPKLRFEI